MSIDRTITYVHKEKSYRVRVFTPYSRLWISVDGITCCVCSIEEFEKTPDFFIHRGIERCEAEKNLGILPAKLQM